MNALLLYQVAHWLSQWRLRWLLRLLEDANIRLKGCRLSSSSHIGPGTILKSGGKGVIIEGGAWIGNPSLWGWDVHITAQPERPGVLVIENGVTLGWGVRV